MNWGENGCFLKGNGCWAIRGSRHLALMVPRGDASCKSSKQLCFVSSLEPGLVDAVPPWLSAFLGMPDSHFFAHFVYIKNRAMQWHFLLLPPCHCMAKIANNFVWGTTFKNQMLIFWGMDNSMFFFDEEEVLSDARQKWVRAKLESIENMFHKHKNFAYYSTCQCTP